MNIYYNKKLLTDIKMWKRLKDKSINLTELFKLKRFTYSLYF